MDIVNISWITSFLKHVNFPEMRLKKRFGLILEKLMARPELSIPGACADGSETKAAYRFFSNERIETEMIDKAFFAATIEKIEDQEMILVAHDTSEFGLGRKKKTKIGGYVSHPEDNGVFMHSALAMTTNALPLGLLYKKVWQRNPDNFRKKSNEKNRLIEDKESFAWLDTIAHIQNLVPKNKTVLAIGDRESDIYALFVQERSQNCHLLARAAQNRLIKDEEHRKLFDAVNAQKVAATIDVEINTADNAKKRVATLEIRYMSTEIKKPRTLVDDKYPETVQMCIVSAKEINVPDEKNPIEWLLLTTMKLDSVEFAISCVKWYSMRWLIERYHFVLKSGCNIEELQFDSIENFERVLATYCIISWRLMHMTYLAREAPDEPCSAVLEPDEWKALVCFVQKTTRAPSKPPTLHEAILMIAKLGGFLGRKSDGNPGMLVVWRGLRRLDDITQTYCIFTKIHK